jgi:rod shape-determining protein MreC
VPRHRTVRFAVLGNSVQRTAASGYPSSRSSALKRRIIVGCLIALSLVLITVSFRSSALDGVQGTAAGILRPFEIAADRVSRPFRDAISWVQGLANAKSENTKLKRQIATLNEKLVLDESAVQENVQLRAELDYHGPPSRADFVLKHAAVLTNPQSALDESITIAAGSRDGIRAGSPVIDSSGGLVGTIDRVRSSIARVTLLTQGQNVTAVDLNNPGATGIVRGGGGAGDVLVFDRVSKAANVAVGNIVISAGSLGKGARFPSIFPRGLRIGTVSSVNNNDVETFKTIQVDPFVDFSSLQSVIVLVPRAGPGG